MVTVVTTVRSWVLQDDRVHFLGPFMGRELCLGVPKRDFASHP